MIILYNVPSYRSDISSQNDLSEEVARIIGYDNISKHKLPLVKGKNQIQIVLKIN